MTCSNNICVTGGSYATGCSCRMSETETVSHRGALAGALLLLGWALWRARRRESIRA